MENIEEKILNDFIPSEYIFTTLINHIPFNEKHFIEIKNTKLLRNSYLIKSSDDKQLYLYYGITKVNDKKKYLKNRINLSKTEEYTDDLLFYIFSFIKPELEDSQYDNEFLTVLYKFMNAKLYEITKDLNYLIE